jgi:hypothetical protein
MRQHLLAAAALLALTTAPAPAETPLEACAMIGELAEAIMDGRQSGMAMSTMMGIVPAKEDPARDLIAALIAEAYDSPRFGTPQNQRRAVQDFRNNVEAQCFKAVK